MFVHVSILVNKNIELKLEPRICSWRCFNFWIKFDDDSFTWALFASICTIYLANFTLFIFASFKASFSYGFCFYMCVQPFSLFHFFPLTGMSQHNTFCIHALLQKEILQKLVQFVSISDTNSEKFSKFLHKETAVGIVCILIAFSFNFYLMHQGEVCVIHRMRNLENSSEASSKYLLHLLLFIE